MAQTKTAAERRARPPVPEPGQAAPDSPSEPQDDVELDDERGTVTRREESGVGPGAGESAVVRVTTPVEREGDTPTKHPSLREKPAEP
ncbi:MAG: hypothetical protein JOZ75_01540 [Candidatus Dormibacteraeota bacterium]|nr:hypothetical protein [Candidatus Dormibacteraeota bacterium]